VQTGRKEFFSRVGLIRVVEPLTEKAYLKMEREAFKLDLEGDPHGVAYHTSFGGPSFPGNDEMACPRKALYGLANFAPPGPAPRQLRTQADSGKAIEYELVRRWEYLGILLSAGAEEKVQTEIKVPELWFSGHPDAIILPPKWDRPHLVEIKSKAHEKVMEMQNRKRGPDAAHVKQAKTYIGFLHELSKELWPDLEPLRDGTIYYVSRDLPSETHEFYIEHDEEFMEIGKQRLKDWKQHFLNDELPARPKEWYWSKTPCQYCPFKKNVCKPDDKAGVTKLSESHGIEYTKSIRKSYDFDITKEIVIKRWDE
jgi:hypothetical protein